MKYIFDQIVYKASKGAKFNAESKARMDVTHIMENEGCQILGVYRRFSIPKLTTINIILYYFRLLFILKSGDSLYIQYPVMRSCLTPFLFLLRVLHKKKVSIAFIIHDLDYIRFKFYAPIKEKILAPLHYANIIVAHTPAMKKHLIKEGIHAPISVLHLFDYLTTDSLVDKEYCLKHKDEIIFAGNLTKSEFLSLLNEYPYKHLKFRLYGLQPDMVFKEGKKYIGAFKPDNTSFIKGGWGLIWDGDAISSCSGLYGEYLKLNASHKLSLYITSGIPVIVWEQCGVAQWIVENKLGISISNLTELDEVIQNVSEEEYSQILECVRKQSQKLRNGSMLLNALKLRLYAT